MSVFTDQEYFMKAAGQTTDTYNRDQAMMCSDLVYEEFSEWEAAETEENLLKETIDCLVVLISFGLSMGWDMHAAWNIVWQSNMSKVDPETGKVVKREDGKVLKPESYQAPDLSGLITGMRYGEKE